MNENEKQNDSLPLPQDIEPAVSDESGAPRYEVPWSPDLDAEATCSVYSYDRDCELTDIRHYRRALVEHVRVK